MKCGGRRGDLIAAHLRQFRRQLEFGQQLGGKIGGIRAILRITRMRFLAGDESGDKLLADRSKSHHAASRAIALIRNRIEIDDKLDIEIKFSGDTGQQRHHSAGSGRTVLFIADGDEQDIGLALVGFHRRNSGGKSRLHVEQPAPG